MFSTTYGEPTAAHALGESQSAYLAPWPPGAVKKLLQKASGERGFALEEVSIRFPVHSATEVGLVETQRAQREGRGGRVCVLTLSVLCRYWMRWKLL